MLSQINSWSKTKVVNESQSLFTEAIVFIVLLQSNISLRGNTRETYFTSPESVEDGISTKSSVRYILIPYDIDI